MLENEFDEFQTLLNATCSLLSRGTYTPNPMNTALFFKSLSRYDIGTVRGAFESHIRDRERGRFVPLPADIIAQIESASANDGRPGDEEAWAVALRSADEAATVVWTDETARAMGEARPVLMAGDKVGARMAFKAVYARLVVEARQQRIPVKWSASLGHDAESRNATLLPHIEAGRLPNTLLQIATQPLSLLLESATKAGNPNGPPEAVLAELRDLREKLSAPKPERVSDDAAGKQQTAELKADAMKSVAQHLNEGEGA